MYLFHPGMDKTEAIIYQHLYWNGIINAARKEVTNCHTFQCKKWSNKKYGKFPSKEDEEIE